MRSEQTEIGYCWIKINDKWAFVLNGGIRLTGIWAKLDYANNNVNQSGWYHFNSSGIMDYGWFRDEHMNWYYCNTVKDGWLGKIENRLAL